MPQAVYRVFNEQMDLLYVGTSMDPFSRFQDHVHTASFAPLARHIKIDWFQSKEEADKAEMEAIVNECPAFNRTFAVKNAPIQSPEEIIATWDKVQRKKQLAKLRQRRKRAKDAAEAGGQPRAELKAGKTQALIDLAKQHDVHTMTIRRWLALGKISLPEDAVTGP